jgi:hypothetical protein
MTSVANIDSLQVVTALRSIITQLLTQPAASQDAEVLAHLELCSAWLKRNAATRHDGEGKSGVAEVPGYKEAAHFTNSGIFAVRRNDLKSAVQSFNNALGQMNRTASLIPAGEKAVKE